MAKTFVYAIHCPNKNEVKIGYATDPLKRLSQLQTGTTDRLDLIYTFAGGIEEEKKLHCILKAHRVSGEWFRYCHTVLQTFTEFAVASRPEALDFVQNSSDREIILKVAHKLADKKRAKKITIPDLKDNLLISPSTRELKDTLISDGWVIVKSGTCKTPFYIRCEKTKENN